MLWTLENNTQIKWKLTVLKCTYYEINTKYKIIQTYT